jgi:acetyl-CoA C-acetyltransferase
MVSGQRSSEGQVIIFEDLSNFHEVLIPFGAFWRVMWEARIAGAGQTPFGRSVGSLGSMVEEAANLAIERASVDDVDAVVLGSMAPMGTLGEAHITSKVMDHLGLTPRPAIRVESGPATGAAAFQAAFWAVASGQHETVLVLAAEKLSHLDRKEASGVLATIATPEERALGLTMPGMTAMMARAYMERYGATEEDLADMAVKAHRIGAGNPLAHRRKVLDRQSVLSDLMVADPLRRYNCAPLSDGAVAIVLTSRYKGSVHVAGLGAATDRVRFTDRKVLDGFPASTVASRKALDMAGLTAADIHLLETHDAFSNLEWSNPEDLGLLGPGEGLATFRRGETGLDGPLPINPSGGLTVKGHPVGASGLSQIAEVAWQLAGEAKGRQVDAAAGMAHSIGGFGASVFVTVLEMA